MSKKLTYEEYSQQFLTQLPKGAFLTVKQEDRLNTMTIGWGSIGYIWRRPILMVMVRYSRHTYDLIDKAPDFTVCLPANGTMKKALAITGSKSGRDTDKFKAADLTIQAAETVESPVIKGCELTFECKTVFKQIMDPEKLDVSIRADSYQNDDYHVMYYGDILACYTQNNK